MKMDVLTGNFFISSLVAGSALLAAGIYILYGSPWDANSGQGTRFWFAVRELHVDHADPLRDACMGGDRDVLAHRCECCFCLMLF